MKEKDTMIDFIVETLGLKRQHVKRLSDASLQVLYQKAVTKAEK